MHLNLPVELNMLETISLAYLHGQHSIELGFSEEDDIRLMRNVKRISKILVAEAEFGVVQLVISWLI